MEGELISLIVEFDDNGLPESAKLGQSCALGAVYEGAFGTPPIKRDEWQNFQVNGGEDQMYNKLKREFPILLLEVPMPSKLYGADLTARGEEADVGGYQDLLSVIIELNDSNGYTRGQIANWIKQLPKQLARIAKWTATFEQEAA